MADELHVHFPWGSLLRAVAAGEAAPLAGMRRICAPGAWLEVVIGLDRERDRAEIERLGLAMLTPEYFSATLNPRYRAAGFDVVESGALPAAEWPRLHTSWAQRLRGGAGRSLSYLIARAVDQGGRAIAHESRRDG